MVVGGNASFDCMHRRLIASISCLLLVNSDSSRKRLGAGTARHKASMPLAACTQGVFGSSYGAKEQFWYPQSVSHKVRVCTKHVSLHASRQGTGDHLSSFLPAPIGPFSVEHSQAVCFGILGRGTSSHSRKKMDIKGRSALKGLEPCWCWRFLRDAGCMHPFLFEGEAPCISGAEAMPHAYFPRLVAAGFRRKGSGKEPRQNQIGIRALVRHTFFSIKDLSMFQELCGQALGPRTS